MSPLDRNRLWSRLAGAVAAHPEPLPTPLMVVDLDAFDANADDLARRAAGTPIRVASKSVRVPDLIARALAHPGFEGVLSYTVAEALWLAEAGISDDIVVAYPSVDRGALAREQVLDRAEHEALALEQVLAGERRRDDADRVVAATAGYLDLGVGQLRGDRGPDCFLDRTHEVGRMIAHPCSLPHTMAA